MNLIYYRREWRPAAVEEGELIFARLLGGVGILDIVLGVWCRMQRHNAIFSRILITEVKMIIYSGQSGSSYDNLISYAYIVDNDIVYTIYARLVVLTVRNTIIINITTCHESVEFLHIQCAYNFG